MVNKIFKNKTLVLTLLIVVLAFLRIIIQIPNVSPVAAIALFGGTYFNKKFLAIIIPLSILLLSDMIIGFYSPFLMFGVYGSFVLISVVGFWLRKNLKVLNIIASSLFSSVLFFIITNLFVWLEGLWYPMTTKGLIECYIMAIPFFKYEVLGTLIFSAFFFGTYSLYLKYILVLQKIR